MNSERIKELALFGDSAGAPSLFVTSLQDFNSHGGVLPEGLQEVVDTNPDYKSFLVQFGDSIGTELGFWDEEDELRWLVDNGDS